jgi:hypothetical protein
MQLPRRSRYHLPYRLHQNLNLAHADQVRRSVIALVTVRSAKSTPYLSNLGCRGMNEGLLVRPVRPLSERLAVPILDRRRIRRMKGERRESRLRRMLRSTRWRLRRIAWMEGRYRVSFKGLRCLCDIPRLHHLVAFSFRRQLDIHTFLDVDSGF